MLYSSADVILKTHHCSVPAQYQPDHDKNPIEQIASSMGQPKNKHNLKTNQNEPADSEGGRNPAQELKAHSCSLHLATSIFANSPRSDKVLIHCNWL